MYVTHSRYEDKYIREWTSTTSLAPETNLTISSGALQAAVFLLYDRKNDIFASETRFNLIPMFNQTIKAMKRFFSILSVILLVMVSCKKLDQEVIIDYSSKEYASKATLYRVGDDSFGKPIDQPTLEKYSLICYFNNSEVDPEVFLLDMALYDADAFVKGEAIVPKRVFFGNPHGYADLGLTRTIEKGTMRFLGEKDRSYLIRFEDVTFKVTRNDGSKITDTYYIRGTAAFDYSR